MNTLVLPNPAYRLVAAHTRTPTHSRRAELAPLTPEPMPKPSKLGATQSARMSRHRQRGVVTIEFALMLMLGLIPLLLLTFSGTMIFAAKQSLSLAAAEGARATLHYGTLQQRHNMAEAAAKRSMEWLINFAGTNASVSVSAPAVCESGSATWCYTVTTSYDYTAEPFLPGTKTLYGWVMNGPITDTATAQLDAESARQLNLTP